MTLLGGRVAPAEHEGPQPAAGGVLDKAAPGPQVQEVEPPDGRRDDQDRAGEYRVGGRGVLQDLCDRVPGHDGAGGQGQVPADLEGAGFDHGRHPAIVADVAGEVAGSAGQAHAAGFEGVLEGGRVGHQEVRRRHGAGHDAGRKPGLLRPGAAGAFAQLGDDSVQRLRRGEISLLENPERRVRRPCRIGEAPVTLGRSHIGPP